MHQGDAIYKVRFNSYRKLKEPTNLKNWFTSFTSQWLLQQNKFIKHLVFMEGIATETPSKHIRFLFLHKFQIMQPGLDYHSRLCDFCTFWHQLTMASFKLCGITHSKPKRIMNMSWTSLATWQCRIRCLDSSMATVIKNIYCKAWTPN